MGGSERSAGGSGGFGLPASRRFAGCAGCTRGSDDQRRRFLGRHYDQSSGRGGPWDYRGPNQRNHLRGYRPGRLLYPGRSWKLAHGRRLLDRARRAATSGHGGREARSGRQPALGRDRRLWRVFHSGSSSAAGSTRGERRGFHGARGCAWIAGKRGGGEGGSGSRRRSGHTGAGGGRFRIAGSDSV